VVSFNPRLLYSHGKSPWYPVDRRLGGPQSRSAQCGEERNSQPLSGLELPIIKPVAQCYTTEPSRLLKLSKSMTTCIRNPVFPSLFRNVSLLFHSQTERNTTECRHLGPLRCRYNYIIKKLSMLSEKIISL
jgi:hypothetical protein